LFSNKILSKTETEESTLSEAFGAHGTVNKITIPTDRNTGKGRGFAFIEMSTKAELEAACAALNEIEMGTRKISVYESLPKGQKRERVTRPGNYNCSPFLLSLLL
jgi:RNA recognition motif-containing protein